MKRLTALLLTVVLLVSASVVATASGTEIIELGEAGTDIYTIQLRLIELGYLNYRPTGNFGDITRDAVRSFQIANGLPGDGQIGSETMNALFSDEAKRAAMNPAFKSAVGRAYTGTVTDKGDLSSWDEISQLFEVGSVVTVTDYNTGEKISLRRTGGTNNAEVVTESSADHDTFEYVFGGYSWEHRPVLVDIDGRVFAGSLFGMPTRTGSDSTGSMSGVTFLYFNNSRSDVQGLSDEEHAVSITGISD